MTIPTSVRVGARTYSVIMIDPDPDTVFERNGELLGQIDYKQQTIKLLATSAPETREASFLHELVTAPCSNLRFDQGGRPQGDLETRRVSNLAIAFDLGHTDHNEREVDLLANALHRLITDNPGLFDCDKPFT